MLKKNISADIGSYAYNALTLKMLLSKELLNTESCIIVRGRGKIDLKTLNVKLTLKGRGSLVGLGLTLRKKWGKANEKVRKSNNWCLNKKCSTSANVLFYNIHGGHNDKISRVFDERLWIQMFCASTDGM